MTVTCAASAQCQCDAFMQLAKRACQEAADLRQQATDALVHRDVHIDDDPREPVVVDVSRIARRTAGAPPPLYDVADEEFFHQLDADLAKPLPLAPADAEVFAVPAVDPYQVARLQLSLDQVHRLRPAADYDAGWDLRAALDRAKAALDAYFAPIVLHCDPQLALPADFGCPPPLTDNRSPKVPIDHIHQGLDFVCRMSAEVMRDCQQLTALKDADLSAHIADLEEQLHQHLDERSRSSGIAVSSRDVTVHGTRAAWAPGWWTREKRERAAQYVTAHAEHWERDDAMDDLAGQLFAALERQFLQTLQLLELEKRLGLEAEVRAVLALLGEGADRIARLAHDAKQTLALAQEDLRALDAAGGQVKTLYPDRTHEIQENLASHKALLDSIAKERIAIQEDLVNLTKAFRQTKLGLEDAMRHVGFSPAELQLKAEVAGLQQLLALVQRQLGAREEELRRAEARCDTDRPESQRRQLAALQAQLQAAEAEFEAKAAGLRHALDALRQSRADSLRRHVLLELADRQRRLGVQTLLANLRAHTLDVQRCIGALKADIEVLYQAQEVTTSLMGGISGYFDHLRQKCNDEMPALCLRALELGARLAEWHATMEVDKSARIVGMDPVLKSQLQMLEFYVDTTDPLAHKHQTIISELHALRLQYELDMQSHEEAQTKSLKKCRLVDRLFHELLRDVEEGHPEHLHRYRELRERWPAFFTGLEAGGPLSAPLELPEPPRSSDVIMKYVPNPLLELLASVRSRPPTPKAEGMAVAMDDLPTTPDHTAWAVDIDDRARSPQRGAGLPAPRGGAATAVSEATHGDPRFVGLADGSPVSAYVQQLRSEVAVLRKQVEERDVPSPRGEESAAAAARIRPHAAADGDDDPPRSLADELLQELWRDADAGDAAPLAQSVGVPRPGGLHSLSEHQFSSTAPPSLAAHRRPRHRLSTPSLRKSSPTLSYDARQFRLKR